MNKFIVKYNETDTTIKGNGFDIEIINKKENSEEFVEVINNLIRLCDDHFSEGLGGNLCKFCGVYNAWITENTIHLDFCPIKQYKKLVK